MNKENINLKIWYRAIKVVFVSSFILVQMVGLIWIIGANNPNKKVLDYNDRITYSKLRPATLEEKKEFDFSKYGTPISTSLVQENSLSQDKRGAWLRLIGFILVSVSGVTAFFWLLKRVFSYIFLKEDFFRM